MEAIGTVDELNAAIGFAAAAVLFVLARYANHVAGTIDIIWAPRAKAPEG